MSTCKNESPALLGRMFKLAIANGRAALSIGGRTLGVFEGDDEITEITRDLLDANHDFIVEGSFGEMIVRGFPDGSCTYRERDEN